VTHHAIFGRVGALRVVPSAGRRELPTVLHCTVHCVVDSRRAGCITGPAAARLEDQQLVSHEGRVLEP
jgi:hypothetical protein